MKTPCKIEDTGLALEIMDANDEYVCTVINEEGGKINERDRARARSILARLNGANTATPIGLITTKLT